MTATKIGLLLLLTATSYCFVVRKCCPHGQILDDTLSCVAVENFTEWIPDYKFVVQSSNSTLKITNSTTIIKDLYKRNVSVGFPECDLNFRDETLIWKDFTLAKGFYFTYDSHKSAVQLNFYRKSAYHENATLSYYRQFSPESYCVDAGPSESHLIVLCPCLNSTCIRKCCHDGEIFDEDSQNCIQSSNVTELEELHYENWTPDFYTQEKNETRDPEHFLLLGKLPPCSGTRGTYPVLETHENSFLYKSDGVVTINTTSAFESKPDEHCGEYSWNKTRGTLKQMMLVCFEKKFIENKMEREQLVPLYTFLMIMASLLFLASAVVLFFGLNPDLVGKRGSAPILGHVSNFVVANTAAIISYFSTGVSLGVCIVTGYVMQFSFLASFFWLNVMCIDMSWTFSGIRPPGGSHRDREKRKFMWYSLYAWGGSSALTLAAIIVDFTPGVSPNSPYKPNIGAIKCWFKDDEALWLYFYGPMGILLLSNLALFVYTSFRIVMLKKGTGALRKADSAQHGNNKNQQRFVLYAKLFLLMGVTWLTEIISWVVGGGDTLNYLWYVTDAINVFRAVFIFIIFCWKPRVWINVKKRFPWTKRCEDFFVRTCCRREPTPDPQDDQKTSSTNGGQKDTSENGAIEMEAK